MLFIHKMPNDLGLELLQHTNVVKVEINNISYEVVYKNKIKLVLEQNISYVLDKYLRNYIRTYKYKHLIIEFFGKNEFDIFNEFNINQRNNYNMYFYEYYASVIKAPSAWLQQNLHNMINNLANKIKQQYGEEEYLIYKSFDKEINASYRDRIKKKDLKPSIHLKNCTNRQKQLENAIIEIKAKFGDSELALFESLGNARKDNYMNKYLIENKSVSFYLSKNNKKQYYKAKNMIDKDLSKTYNVFGRSFVNKTLKKFEMLIKQSFETDDIKAYFEVLDKESLLAT